MKKIGIALVALGLAGSPAADAFDLNGLLGAGTDLLKAATLSDGEVQSMAFQASQVQDKQNKVAGPSSPYTKRLARITRGMENDDGMKLNFKVYLTKEVNAFAMADGTVRVYSGLMDKMSDDEVRYVIGHEIGHVKLGHSRKAMQTAYATSAARKAAAASGYETAAALSESALGQLAEAVVNAQFSQSQESDADAYSVGFMKRHRYDPHAAVSALQKLAAMYGNDSSMLSSHPAPGDRAKAVARLI